MLIFQLDIAFILETALIGAGFIILHKAVKEPPAGLLKTAGYLFILAGILTMPCTLYYGFKYWFQGDFDRGAVVVPLADPHAPCAMMKSGMMQEGMAPGGMMMNGGPMSSSASGAAPVASAGSAAHDAHHPGEEPPAGK